MISGQFHRDRNTGMSLSREARFGSYVDLYTNLDNLIWRNMATFLGVTVLGAGFMGALLEHNDLTLLHLSHNQTVGAAFLLVAGFYAITIFIVTRMQWHHRQLDLHLATLEPGGYFALRTKGKWWLSAVLWVRISFMIMMALCLLAALAYFKEGKMSDTKSTSSQSGGLIISGEVMPNGEVRSRAMFPDGSGYIRTETTVGNWQNSHSHKHVAETYVVERGWMAMATENGKLQPKITIYRAGGIVTTVQGIAHNIYLPAGAIIHTVKHNGQGGKDWDAAPELDEHTKQLKESDVLRLGKA